LNTAGSSACNMCQAALRSNTQVGGFYLMVQGGGGGGGCSIPSFQSVPCHANPFSIRLHMPICISQSSSGLAKTMIRRIVNADNSCLFTAIGLLLEVRLS
jgi:hypothetical protein